MTLLAGMSAATAGEMVEPTLPPAPEPAKKISGSLAFDAYSHFISYGADVWDDGDEFGNFAFNPSLELTFDLGGGLSASLGTWWDVNDKGGDSFGGHLEEIDVWAGLSYTKGIYTVSATYQQWYYGDSTEEILDLGLAIDTFLSPSLTIHQRIDAGASGGDEGTIAVLGLEHGFEAGPVSFSVPLNVAYFITDDFHGPGADSGFGYASLGLGASVPLEFMSDSLGGDWAFNAGLTYYVTNDDVVIGDPEDSFLVTNFGISCDF